MTTVTGLTADRMLAIEAASVVDGDVVGDNLVLTTRGGNQIQAGNVRGPQGTPGAPGAQGPAGVMPAGIGCRISNAAAISVLNNTPTQILDLTLELFDDGNLHTSALPGRAVAPVTGIYVISVRVNWAPNVVGRRGLELHKYTPQSAIAEGYTDFISAAVSEQHGMTCISKAQAGEFWAIWVQQDSGGPLNLQPEGVQLMVAKVG